MNTSNGRQDQVIYLEKKMYGVFISHNSLLQSFRHIEKKETLLLSE